MSEKRESGLLTVFVHGILIVATVGAMFGGYKALFKDKEEFFRFCTQYFWVWWSLAVVAAVIWCKWG